jgi:hypothetical protein
MVYAGRGAELVLDEGQKDLREVAESGAEFVPVSRFLLQKGEPLVERGLVGIDNASHGLPVTDGLVGRLNNIAVILKRQKIKFVELEVLLDEEGHPLHET